MLLISISPIYLRCGVLINNSEELEKELEFYKDKFTYIKQEKNLNYKTKKLILFQINYFDAEKFIKSTDYEFLEKLNVIESITLEEKDIERLEKKLLNHKDSITYLREPRNKSEISSCYFCGKLTGKIENIIYKVFRKKCIRYGTSTDLSVKGIDYINNNIPNSFFNVQKETILNLVRVGKSKPKPILTKQKYELKNNLYPFILTSGDEGICVYRIDSIDSYKKIGGNIVGPTSIWSLFYLSCNYEDLEFAMNEAFKGNNEFIDLSVGDIYGGDYSGIGLSSDIIASSFSKVNVSDINLIEKKDIGKSLAIFYGVTYAQVSALISSKENINKIIVSGDAFDCLELMQLIESCLWELSGNTMEAVFCDYSKFFEIIGMVVELDKNGLL